jgi:hypothetical protein
VLLASCATGLGVSLAAHQFAAPFQPQPSVLLTIRAAFVPVAAGAAFLAANPHRNLTTSLPAPTWVTTAAHLVMALPLISLTGFIQLQLAAAELRGGGRAAGGTPALPWAALATELVAWLAFSLAVAALVARTRWNDLGGALAAPAALGCIALLAVSPLRLFPAAFTGLTPAQHSAWLHAEWAWWALGQAAALTACWASRDPWHRLRPEPRRRRAATVRA